MGFAHDEYSISHVRLCKDRIDLGDELQCEQLDYQIDEAAEAAPPHLWASIPFFSAMVSCRYWHMCETVGMRKRSVFKIGGCVHS